MKHKQKSTEWKWAVKKIQLKERESSIFHFFEMGKDEKKKRQTQKLRNKDIQIEAVHTRPHTLFFETQI